MAGYRLVAALALASVGVLAGVIALVAVASLAIAIERSINAHAYEKDCRELEIEVEHIRPLALITQVQTETARLLLNVNNAGVAPEGGNAGAASKDDLLHLPNIDEVEVWEQP